MVTGCCDENVNENVPSFFTCTCLPRAVLPATKVELPVHCVSFAYGIEKFTRLPLLFRVRRTFSDCEVLPAYLPVRTEASAAVAATAGTSIAAQVMERTRDRLGMVDSNPFSGVVSGGGRWRAFAAAPATRRPQGTNHRPRRRFRA